MLARYRDWSDIVIATALIVAGSAALIARLDAIDLPELSNLLHWWPLLLIGLGTGLWRLERSARSTAPSAKSDSKESTR
jgi:hypothetical protein